jgi:hypothetical protein
MNNNNLWKPNPHRTWGIKELHKDTEGKFHPWETNDEVFYSPDGIPCKAPSQEVKEGCIVITMAYLSRLRPDLKEVQGEWAFSSVRVNAQSFIRSFTCL